MYKKEKFSPFALFGISLFLLLVPLLSDVAEASHNPNLSVSAENSMFDNHFAGSVVVEVVVDDPGLRDTDEGKGEPNVTVNGSDLRMVQASNGKWYAYFANKEKAQIADQIAFNNGAGVGGESLDFGVFCSSNTAASVFGVTFSDSGAIAVPRSGGLTGATDGTSSFSTCTGSPTNSANLNNVVRSPKTLNKNSAVPVGQIGINENAWPLIQLFSFSNSVIVQYDAAGNSQQVKLSYDEIPNILLSFDRSSYPSGAEVFATINDFQLNQDPTNRDSWTFSVISPQTTFYQAFDQSGSNSANGGTGLIDLAPHLSSLGFEKNGKLSLSLGSVTELKTNRNQPANSVTDGTTTFQQIVTFLESEPNSAIFENFDFSDQSTITILNNAPRGQSDAIKYNSKSVSILSGTFTASVSIGLRDAQFNPGQKNAVTLVDPDQNINSGSREHLDVFRSSAIIPSLQIGNPVTLENASDVRFDAISVTSSVPDTNSDRLIIDTTSVGTTNFDAISLNLGITANVIQSLLLDVGESNTNGTNWLNYDLRSFEQQLGVTDFSDTSMTLFFGGLTDSSPVTILDKGNISSAQGLVQIDNEDVTLINAKSGGVFLVIDFDSSNDTNNTGAISNETDTQPIVFDLFSFGEKNNQDINNAIYRLELEEVTTNSGTFTGTIEYAVTNQLNQFDPNFIRTLKTIDDKIKFLVNDRLIDEKGIAISYSDIAKAGTNTDVSAKTDIRTHSGGVSLNSKTLRLGQPVVVTLTDPDLNQNHDTIEIYLVIDDPNSLNVDTVGSESGGILLEIKIKDVRYKRCTINGVEFGGLASTGFTLVETGTNTGKFQGSFKLPSKICNKEGSELITPIGGNVELEYHDFNDAFGKPNIFGSTLGKPSLPSSGKEQKPITQERVPTWIKSNAKVWSERQIGNSNFLSGIQYMIKEKIIDRPDLPPQASPTAKEHVPDWIRNNAGWWADNLISEDDFVNGIKWLLEKRIIRV